MTTPVRHTSLEAQFSAAVPPQRASLVTRAAWWLALKALKLRPVQRIIEKKYPT